MATTPDGSVVDEVNSGEDDPVPPRGAGRDNRGERRTSPTPGGAGGSHLCGGYVPDPPEPPNPIDQLVAALHDAGLSTNPRCQRHHGRNPDPESDDDGRRPRVKIPPPIFKALPGERPDAHLLAAADWMEAMRIRPIDFIGNFKHTLQHLACEWYHGLDIDDFHENWREFTSHFSRYFSTQGRNIKHLHERWQTFSFDPSTDDIEEYIRDVREAAKQLRHGDNAVLNLLKATMPIELYGTLYSHDSLYVVMTMLKDICQEASKYGNCSCQSSPGSHCSLHPHPLPHQRCS